MTPEDAKRLKEINNFANDDWRTPVEDVRWLVAKVRELDEAGKEMIEVIEEYHTELYHNDMEPSTSPIVEKYRHLFAPMPEEGR